MTAGGIIILLTQAVTLVITLLALYTSVRAARKNAVAIQEVHVIMNSRLDEMMKLQAKSSHAEGVKDEKERLK